MPTGQRDRGKACSPTGPDPIGLREAVPNNETNEARRPRAVRWFHWINAPCIKDLRPRTTSRSPSRWTTKWRTGRRGATRNGRPSTL
jgi:hypothetical protein